MGALKAIRRLLRKRGLIPYTPYQCRKCGFTVPLVGSRRYQASIAFEHWVSEHEGEAT